MDKLDLNQEGNNMLNRIKDTQEVIKNKGVKGYLPWFFWGLFVLITYPSFDFIKSFIWYIIAIIIFIVGIVLSYYYYIIVNRHIHSVSHSPWYMSLLYFILIAITILLANIFQPNFHYSWVLGGIILAALFFMYGFYLKLKY